jgi:tellurium resistance protein TerD
MSRISKKQTINLIKKAPTLSLVRVALSWEQSVINNQLPDCDVSALMLSAEGTLPNESYFVFYNNLQSGDGSVKHNGDNRTGRGDGDNETIDVDLSTVSDEIVQICFTISINNANVGFNFSNVTNASVRIYNLENNEVLCEYYLNESFPDADTLNLGRLYRYDKEWHFEALGDAYTGGLQATLDSLQTTIADTESDFTSGYSIQQHFANSFCSLWSDAIVKKIDKDNFLDIHIPSVHPKYGTHLGVNTAKGQIKLCFYCRDAEFVANAIQSSTGLEQYAQGIRLVNNPVFQDVNEAVRAADEFLKKINQ